MMDLSPQRIFATTDILEIPAARERTERMVAAMTPGSVEWVSMEELDRIVASGIWDPMPYWGEMTAEQKRDPDLVFTTGKFLPEDERARLRERYPHLGPRDLYGLSTFEFRSNADAEWRRRAKGVICTSAWELRTIKGCPFRCSYCWLGTMNRVLVNIEQFIEHLDELFTRDPRQRIYKWDNQTDIPCFEPEYDASRPLVERFARESDRYLEIYVGKSANTDYLLDLDHAGKTILQWSVCGDSQQRLFEERTDTPTARLQAAERCQKAGYLVRFRLSPIVPVKGWREENRALIEGMFARTKPDVVSLCTYGWRDVEETERMLDFDALDEDFVAAMRSAAPFLHARGYEHGGARPIPHDARYVMLEFLIDEIQRVSPQTTIALCLETVEMWRALGEKIGQSPEAFVCNCGPHCTPGGALYEKRVNRRPQPAGPR